MYVVKVIYCLQIQFYKCMVKNQMKKTLNKLLGILLIGVWIDMVDRMRDNKEINGSEKEEIEQEKSSNKRKLSESEIVVPEKKNDSNACTNL